jgi:hypothetical protein
VFLQRFAHEGMLVEGGPFAEGRGGAMPEMAFGATDGVGDDGLPVELGAVAT